jgi:hypothetical protein
MTSRTSIFRPRQLSVVFVVLLGLVGGCAQPGPGGRGPGPGPGPGTYQPDDVVLRVDLVDGFIPREYLVTRLPKVSVYGDGRVITGGPVIDIYPYPALPNVLVQTISPAGVNALVVGALDHGVGNGADVGQPNIMDAASTRFTVLTDEGPLVSSANALFEGDGGLTAAQRSARSALRDLLDDLADLSKTLGPDAVGEQEPYQPKVLAAVSREWTAPDSTEAPAQPERAWPGPTLPGGPVGTIPGVGCVTVTGDDLDTVLDAARSADVLTPWTSDGRKWLVGFRPLLPEETSCANLA